MPETPKAKIVEPQEGTPRTYANQVNLFWTGVDITLAFGELLQSSEVIAKGQPAIVESVKITLPWSVGKLLGTVLVKAVTDYEQKNGELKLPGEYQLP